MSTNSKWYTLKVDPTTVTPETFQRLKGNVVNEDFLMHAPDTDALFFCVENGIGQRAMIPTEAITPLQAYRGVLLKLCLYRNRIRGGYKKDVEHERGLTALSRQIWEDLSDEEQELIYSEGHVIPAGPAEDSNTWYMILGEDTTIPLHPVTLHAGDVVHMNVLMPILPSGQLVYCVEGLGGQRVGLEVRPVTPMLAYRKLEQRLSRVRQLSNGLHSTVEDSILETMDVVWVDLTTEERAILDAEGPQAKNVRSEDKPQDPQVAQPCN